MEFIDKSGQPRDDEEIQEAIEYLTKDLVQSEPHPRMIYHGVAISGLKELLGLRRVLRGAKDARKDPK